MSPTIGNLANHTADTANFIFKEHFLLCWSLQHQWIFSSLWPQSPNRKGSIGSNYRFRGRIHYGKRSRETQWGGSVSKDFHRARSQLWGVFRTYKQSTASEWSDMRLLTSQVFNSLWLEGIRQCFIWRAYGLKILQSNGCICHIVCSLIMPIGSSYILQIHLNLIPTKFYIESVKKIRLEI